MKSQLAIVGLLLISAATAAQPSGAPMRAIDHALRLTSSVSFYFVSRTENYDYGIKQMKSEASIFVMRKCGGNCAYFMLPVLAHLRASKRVNCKAGQQNVLITFGAEHIIYSYSGRLAKYRGQCYYNSKSVGDVLENDQFFFN